MVVLRNRRLSDLYFKIEFIHRSNSVPYVQREYDEDNLSQVVITEKYTLYRPGARATAKYSLHTAVTL